jgi:predicted DNA-binding protein
MEARVNVGFPPELMKRLQAVAEREERTVPAMIRLLVRRGLEELESR